ncbi:MAG: cytochrome c3 family protein [Desulfovibrionaceae bacterium]|nr:cytochrome c3 family protein [Desulfovibrionaceae bacterium]
MHQITQKRIAYLCVLMILCCGMVLLPKLSLADDRMPLKFPPLAQKSLKMPQVFFSHEQHMGYVEKIGGDCASCHREYKEAMSADFLDVRWQPADKQIPYLHAACTSCHVEAGEGPRLVECRTCHSSKIAARYQSGN